MTDMEKEMQEYTTVDKRKIIDSFTNTSLKTLRTLSVCEGSWEDAEVTRELTLSMQELNVLAKKLNSMITNSFSQGAFYEPNLYIDGTIEGIIQQNLKEMLMLLFDVLSDLNGIIGSGYDKAKKNNIEKALGKLLLKLRFEILSLPKDVVPGVANIGNVYAQLNHLGEFNDDRFMVRHMWQTSARKFMPVYGDDDISVVLQGPIKYERNFTLETIMRYRWVYPNVSIIVSTWEGEVTEDFKLLSKAISVDILENVKPSDGGPWNIRFQLKSSFGGMIKAEEKKSKYVMKTRTDQVFLNPDFLVYMKNMLRTFPVNCNNLLERIVFLGGQNSMCTYPFRITDFMAFGRLEDLKKLYSADGFSERLEYTAGDRDAKREQYLEVLGRVPCDSFSSICELNQADRRTMAMHIGRKQDPESYLIQSFYEREIIKKVLSEEDDVLMHYWKFIKNCTVFIDTDELLLFWAKYSEQYMSFSNNISDGGLTHSAWLSIYYSDFC